MTAYDGEITYASLIPAEGELQRSVQGEYCQIGVGLNASPPVIQNIYPTPGVLAGPRVRAKHTAISFEVIDSTPGLRLIVLSMKYANRAETLLVHNGSTFVHPFNSVFSTRSAITGGYRFSILPVNGWADDIEKLWVYALDQAGNMEGNLP